MTAALVNWLISALSILIVANVVPGFKVASFETALIVALVLGVVNAVLRPILLILTLPVNILTLGAFTFVINAGLILLVAKVVPGFVVTGFVPALIAGLILWLISTVLHFVVFPVKT